MKKIISIILCVFLVTSMLPLSTFAMELPDMSVLTDVVEAVKTEAPVLSVAPVAEEVAATAEEKTDAQIQEDISTATSEDNVEVESVEVETLESSDAETTEGENEEFEDYELMRQALCDAAAETNAQDIPDDLLGHPLLQGVSTLSVGDNNFYEVEPNNSMSLADRIYDDYTVYGTISSSDRMDFYKIVLTTESEVYIVSVADYRSFMFGIWDSSDEIVAAGLSTGTTSSGNYGDAVTCTLPAGTYYVAVLDEYQYYNEYVFYIDITPTASSHTHSYSSVVTKPTCGEQGYTTYTCSCGDSYKSNYVSATGNHTYSGSTDATCNVCGYNRNSSSGGDDIGVGDLPFTEIEPNNSMSTADRIYNKYTVSGTISSSDRLDYYKIVITEASEVVIVSVADRRNFMIGIMDASGEAVAAGVDTGMNDSGYYGDTLYCTLPVGTYYVVPLDSDGRYNSYVFYIEITPTAEAEVGVVINSENFPDDNFRAYVREEFDTDSSGVLSSSEIEAVTEIYCYDMGISTFEGIEYFPELKDLICGSNNLTSLDVSSNTNLEFLSCGPNQLKTLDVSNNTKLTTLSCWGNQLSSLDLSKNTKLEMLNCGINNLTELNVSQLTALETLYCEENELGVLDLSNNLELEILSVEGNPLVTLDVSSCPHLITAVESGDRSVENNVVYYDYFWEGDPDIWEDDLTSYLSCDTTDIIQTSTHTHSYSSKVTAPTCVSQGYTTYTCSCGDTYKANYVAATGHKTELRNAAEATCTTAGYTGDHVCTVCGTTTARGQELEATGHVEVIDAAVAPTCTATGLTKGSHCSVCGDVIVAQEAVTVLEHTWDAGKVTKEPALNVDGVKTYTCSGCGGTKTEAIPAIHYDVTNDGTTNALDLVALMRHIVGAETAKNADALDVNGDSKVNILDVIRLVRYLAG